MPVCNRCGEYVRTTRLGRRVCKECMEKQLEKVSNNKRVATLKRKFGLSPQAYFDMLTRQDGRCAICKDLMDDVCVDHCHKTSAVRGLLCRKCNVGIGMLGDDADRLMAAIRYLNATP